MQSGITGSHLAQFCTLHNRNRKTDAIVMLKANCTALQVQMLGKKAKRKLKLN